MPPVDLPAGLGLADHHLRLDLAELELSPDVQKLVHAGRYRRRVRPSVLSDDWLTGVVEIVREINGFGLLAKNVCCCKKNGVSVNVSSPRSRASEDVERPRAPRERLDDEPERGDHRQPAELNLDRLQDLEILVAHAGAYAERVEQLSPGVQPVKIFKRLNLQPPGSQHLRDEEQGRWMMGSQKTPHGMFSPR